MYVGKVGVMAGFPCPPTHWPLIIPYHMNSTSIQITLTPNHDTPSRTMVVTLFHSTMMHALLHNTTAHTTLTAIANREYHHTLLHNFTHHTNQQNGIITPPPIRQIQHWRQRRWRLHSQFAVPYFKSPGKRQVQIISMPVSETWETMVSTCHQCQV